MYKNKSLTFVCEKATKFVISNCGLLLEYSRVIASSFDKSPKFMILRLMQSFTTDKDFSFSIKFHNGSLKSVSGKA